MNPLKVQILFLFLSSDSLFILKKRWKNFGTNLVLIWNVILRRAKREEEMVENNEKASRAMLTWRHHFEVAPDIQILALMWVL